MTNEEPLTTSMSNPDPGPGILGMGLTDQDKAALESAARGSALESASRKLWVVVRQHGLGLVLEALVTQLKDAQDTHLVRLRHDLQAALDRFKTRYEPTIKEPTS